MQAIDRPDLIELDYQQNHHRVRRRKRQPDEVKEAMNKAGVPVGRVVTVKEVVENDQVEARGAVRGVWVENKKSEQAGGVGM